MSTGQESKTLVCGVVLTGLSPLPNLVSALRRQNPAGPLNASWVSVSRKHLLKNGCSFLDEEGREGTANRDLSLAQLPGPVGTSKAVTDQGNPTVLGTTF